MGRLILVVVLLTACGSVVPRAATVTPSPSPAATSQPPPTPSRSDFLAIVGGPKNTSVSLVASDGTVVATAPVDLPAFWMHTQMSWTSASRTRLYYLDGSEVRFLAPDGSTGLATKIALGPTEQPGFAVSPDDASIAVSVFSYTLVSGPPASATYKGMRLYVEDLHGGGHHVDIFSSTTVAEFPIGWTSGRLILAVSGPNCCRARTINPYDATSYHVVDPATGTRLASLCEVGAGPEGPVEPAGVICMKTEPEFLRWDASHFLAPAAISDPTPFLNALSPDGTRVAGSQGQASIRIWGPRGSGGAIEESGYVVGWLDNDRIVFEQLTNHALSVAKIVPGVTSTRLWDVGAIAEIAGGGVYLGTFPAAVT